MKNIEISPSILSCDFRYLDKEINSIKDYVKYLHFDVMDGNFVPNISFGIPVLESINKGNYGLVNDVHLMIINPLKYIERFIDAGANIVTFHYEACVNDMEINKAINLIHSKNALAGLSIKPGTDVCAIVPFAMKLDLVLVMSVEPGFGGQKFNPNVLNKIKRLDDLRKKEGYHYLIEVDGGINEITGKECVDNGADILVAGSYIFKNEDRKKACNSLK